MSLRPIFLAAWLLLSGQASALTIYKYTDANGVVTYTDKAAPGAQVFVFRDRMVEQQDPPGRPGAPRSSPADALQAQAAHRPR